MDERSSSGPFETFYARVVGHVIRGQRALCTMSLQQITKRMAFLSSSGWSRVETGETAISLVQLRRASRALGLQPAEIIRQADALATQLEAAGVTVHDEKPCAVDTCLTGSAMLALLQARSSPSLGRPQRSFVRRGR